MGARQTARKQWDESQLLHQNRSSLRPSSSRLQIPVSSHQLLVRHNGTQELNRPIYEL